MGDLLGVRGFDKPEELQKMNRELNAASRRDAKTIRDAGAEGNELRGTLIGKVNKATPNLEFAPAMRTWMKVMRDHFAKHVIRRTIDSLDYRNQKLFGMRPYIEHFLKLRMYDWEMDNLRNFAKEIIKDNPMAAAADTRKVGCISVFSMNCRAMHIKSPWPDDPCCPAPSWTASALSFSSHVIAAACRRARRPRRRGRILGWLHVTQCPSTRAPSRTASARSISCHPLNFIVLFSMLINGCLNSIFILNFVAQCSILA